MVPSGKHTYQNKRIGSQKDKNSSVTVAGIILAAGESKRFGKPKQLLSWRGKSILYRTVETAICSKLFPVIVVLGANASKIQESIGDLPIKIIINPNWKDGQSTSLITGLQILPKHQGAAMFLLSDTPFVNSALIHSLLQTYFQERKPITAPLVDGQRGNPVIFDKCTFPDLRMLTGDKGGRHLFTKFPVSWVPWYDRRILFDIDTPNDYERLLAEEI